MANNLYVNVRCNTAECVEFLRKASRRIEYTAFELGSLFIVEGESGFVREMRLNAMARDAAHVTFGNISSDLDCVP